MFRAAFSELSNRLRSGWAAAIRTRRWRRRWRRGKSIKASYRRISRGTTSLPRHTPVKMFALLHVEDCSSSKHLAARMKMM